MLNLCRDGWELANLVTGKLLTRGALPCSVICRDPFILAGFGTDFIKVLPHLPKVLPQRKIHFLWKMGYECETEERVREEVALLDRLRNCGLDVSCTCLCNSPLEVDNLNGRGHAAILCNHNAFLDERLLPILANHPKRYDAIYLARLTPCKRHHLAREVERLHVIGSYLEHEKDYAIRELESIKHADWTKKVLGFRVPRHYAAARVGLCLSDREGAMYASAEYLLCGLPVVSTHNIGGRDEFFDPEYVRSVPANTGAVAAAVRELIQESHEPQKIRQRTLEKMQTHRDRYLELLGNIFAGEGKSLNQASAWQDFGFHKLGVRTTLAPRRALRSTLRARS